MLRRNNGRLRSPDDAAETPKSAGAGRPDAFSPENREVSFTPHEKSAPEAPDEPPTEYRAGEGYVMLMGGSEADEAFGVRPAKKPEAPEASEMPEVPEVPEAPEAQEKTKTKKKRRADSPDPRALSSRGRIRLKNQPENEGGGDDAPEKRTKRLVVRRRGEPETEDVPALRLVKGKKKRDYKKWIRRGVAAAVVVALLLGAGFLWSRRDVLTPVNIEEWWDSWTASYPAGQGFPILSGGSRIYDSARNSGGFVVLSDASLQLFSDTGYEIMSRQHGCREPAMSVTDHRVLVYDRGSTGFSIHNRRRELFSGDTETNIILGALSEHGEAVLAVEGAGGYAAQIVAYDATASKVLYRWHSSSALPTALAVSPDGNRAAAATVSAVSGGLVSELVLLDFSSETPVYLPFEDTLFFAVHDTGSRIIAVGEDRCVSVAYDGTDLREYSFDGGRAAGFSFNGESVAAAFSPYQDRRECEIVLLDRLMEEKTSFKAAGELRDLSLADGRVTLLLNGRTEIYRTDGTLVFMSEVSGGASRIAESGMRVYLVEGSRLAEYQLSHVNEKESDE